MKLKTSAIALAVAGTIAVPMSAQASDSMNAWASIRVGLAMIDTGVSATDSMDISDRASRFGFNAEKDLGNGTTSYGRIEWGMDGAGIRHLYAGLKTDAGDFRVIQRGNTTYYNTVVSPYDWTWWLGPYDQYYADKTFNTAMYSGSAGPVSYSVAIAADGSTDSTSKTELGVTFDAGPVSIGLGQRDRDAEADALTGVSVSGSAGDVSYAVAIQDQGDTDSLNVMVNFAGVTLTFMDQDDGLNLADSETGGIGVSYTYSIGPQTSAWFEYASLDNGTGNVDTSALYATLKFDWK